MRTLKFLPVVAFAFVTVFSSCKKEKEVEPKIDPRDAFVGEYDMEAQCGGDSDKIDFEIEKDSKDEKVLIINSNFFEFLGVEDLEVEVSGNSFEIEPTKFTIIDENGETITGKFTGEGKLKGNELTVEVNLPNGSCELEGEKE